MPTGCETFRRCMSEVAIFCAIADRTWAAGTAAGALWEDIKKSLP